LIDEGVKAALRYDLYVGQRYWLREAEKAAFLAAMDEKRPNKNSLMGRG